MANQHYGHAPMSPIGHGASPQQPTTTSLNVGITVPSVAIPTLLLGWNIYVTPVNAATPFYRQLPATGQTWATSGETFASITFPNIALGTAPTGNTARVTPPPAATVATTGTGFIPAGTYMISVTYVTPYGETTPGPATSITVNGSQGIMVTRPDVPSTGVAQAELIVPRLENWHVTRYAIQVDSVVSEPAAEVYVDSVTTSALLDTTNMGSRNSANADITFRPGQLLVCIWSFADLTANCTFSAYGEKTVGLR